MWHNGAGGATESCQIVFSPPPPSWGRRVQIRNRSATAMVPQSPGQPGERWNNGRVYPIYEKGSQNNEKKG